MSKKVITLLTEEHSPGKQTMKILFNKIKQKHETKELVFELKVLNDENRLEMIYSDMVLADYFLISDADYIRRRAFHESVFDFVQMAAFSARDTSRLEEQVSHLFEMDEKQVRHLNATDWSHLNYVAAG
ncbi:hypothetical protein BKP56_01105 [Marinilactibacillus sp. 15R]|uniref:hypothetical protein n=1 Tax=Marinilactibacillus sp. 15R TaxID=1911586 RepID=UPI0009095565|nr:hypothetical protein [Marinilactibacillus sp. 15R]API88015.1 hypothetical protein BKP56_01105 [Marinilactibacillus sp. 15R]